MQENLISLIPSLISKVKPGIQALIFADQFLEWPAYKSMLSQDDLAMSFEIRGTSFLKLAFLKYAFGLDEMNFYTRFKDSIGFQEYIGEVVDIEDRSLRNELRHFYSAFGLLGELIALIDADLYKQKLILERVLISNGNELTPRLVSSDVEPDTNVSWI